MLFSQDGQKNDEAKKRSLLGTLFGVEIGSDMRALREQGGMFVRMIASIFSMSGLFPKNHPALSDMRARLTMAEVIATAWRAVRFTREGAPQAAVFCAVVGTMAFTGLFILTAILSLFVSNAHAQGIFEPPSPTQDWGKGVLDYIFLGASLPNENGGVLGTMDCSFHTALSIALGYFSAAVLVIAGIILMYHLVAMVVKTAQTGQPFAGANHVWGPIRLVFAVALLVPITTAGGGAPTAGGCTVDGYNTGQYLAFSIAQWGSGLASNIWEKFNSSLSPFTPTASCSKTTGPVNALAGQRTTYPPSCTQGARNLRTIVASLIVLDACAKYAKHYLDTLYSGGAASYGIYDAVTFPAGMASLDPGVHPFGYVEAPAWFGGKSGGTSGNTKQFCGGYEILEEPDQNNIYKTIHTEMYKSGGPFDVLLSDVDMFNAKYLDIGFLGSNFFPPAGSPTPADVQKDYQDIVDAFEKGGGTLSGTSPGVEKAVQTGISAAESAAKTTVTSTYTGSQPFGWVFAGSLFNGIARVQAQKFEAMRNILPVPRLPEFLNRNAMVPPATTPTSGGVIDIPSSVKIATEEYRKILEDNVGISMDIAMATSVAGRTYTASATMPSKMDVMKAVVSGNASDGVANMFIAHGEGIGLWDGDGTLALSFGLSENPITEITALGHKFINYGLWGLVIGGLAAAVPGVGGFVSGLIVFLVSIAFSVGFSLAYVVPLYAFYRFFFGVIMWMMSVFEAIALVPLFALAHVNPGGEGLQGPRGAYGYSMAMQLLLRPALMVFGLIAGFLLFKTALSLLNPAFILASVGTGNMAGFMSLFSKLAYSILYATIVVLLANQCFKLIGVFPQAALRWLGMGGVNEEKVGDPQMLAGASAWVAKEAGSRVATTTAGIAPMIRAIQEKKITDAGTTAAVADRQKALQLQEAQAERGAQQRVEDQYFQGQVLGALGHHGNPFHGRPPGGGGGAGGNANLGPNMPPTTTPGSGGGTPPTPSGGGGGGGGAPPPGKKTP